MENSKVQKYSQQYSNQMVRFNPYAIRKTGLIQSQTLLNVEDYMLICAPFQLSMHRAVLLVILSAQEAVFFRQFRNKLGKISFTFAKNGSRDQVNFFVRAKLDRIGPVKGRANVCLFDLSYSTCPNDLVEILGDYITRYTQLRQQFETFKNRAVEINDETAGDLRFNRFAEIQVGDRKIRPEILSIAVNRLMFNIAEGTAGIEQGRKLNCKLYFQASQFVVTSEVTNVIGPYNGQLQVHYDIEFAVDLVELLDDHFYRLSLQ